MYKQLIIFILLVFSSNGFAQQTNLIPNPSFEVFKNRPIGWYYKGIHFTHTMKYWYSPTETSPDAYGPKVRIPNYWQEKGFGNIEAAEDLSYVGITVYGCNEGKAHCREFVTVELKEPLVIGQKYTAQMYVQNKREGVKINEIGFMFSKEKPQIGQDDEHLILAKAIDSKNGWQKITADFIASKGFDYLTIGNFNSDAQSVKRIEDGLDPFGYCYLDNISLVKQFPFIPIPMIENDLRLEEMVVGKEIVLKNVHFDTDKSTLRPQSERELLHLIEILKAHPLMEIQILGYTDNVGQDEYNQKLSERRTKAVLEFVTQNGSIDKDRMTSKGMGELNPLYENESAEGRQLNRRVSFKIIKM